MKISVTVRPGSAEDEVVHIVRNSYRVKVRAQAHGGEANDAVVRVLAAYFVVPKRSVAIVSGHTSRRKLVEIT